MMNQGELRQLQSMPLDYAVRKSIRTIEEAYEMFDGNLVLCVSGFDSMIVTKLFEMAGLGDLPMISIPTVEPKGNNRLNAQRENIEWVLPLRRKKDIVRHYGYPVINKQVAMAISRYVLTKFPEQKEYRLHGRVTADGKKHKVGTIPKKYQELIYSPFYLTEKCCVFQKENPMKSWQKKHGNMVPVTGERADESNTRLKQYLKHGCIVVDQKSPKVMPIGFWTDQMCKQFALKYDLTFSEEYGSIVTNVDTGDLVFTGEPRTGCDICAFGIGYDLERFARMKQRHDSRWQTMMNGGEFVVSPQNLWRPVKFGNFANYLTEDQMENNVRTDADTGEMMTNLVWVPNNKGYGYREVLRYVNDVLGMAINID